MVVAIDQTETIEITYYGPHECDMGCGETIVRGSVVQGFGHRRFDYPIGEVIYPNHKWQEHQCKNAKPKIK